MVSLTQLSFLAAHVSTKRADLPEPNLSGRQVQAVCSLAQERRRPQANKSLHVLSGNLPVAAEEVP